MTVQQNTPVSRVEVTSVFPFQGTSRNFHKFHAGPEHKQHMMGTVYVPKEQVGNTPPAFVEVTVTIPKVQLPPQ